MQKTLEISSHNERSNSSWKYNLCKGYARISNDFAPNGTLLNENFQAYIHLLKECLKIQRSSLKDNRQLVSNSTEGTVNEKAQPFQLANLMSEIHCPLNRQ